MRMTHSQIPTSKDLVRQTREDWGMTKAEFGPKLGFTGEFAGQVEHGKRIFSDKDITTGCTHPDAAVRTFWREYKTARQHEQETAIIENCFGILGA